jgi:hypothetical protein
MIARVIVGSIHSWAALGAVVVLVSGLAGAQEKRTNAIASLKSLSSGETYEIEVTSEEPFLRSDLPVLRVGNQDITISRAPDDGGSYARIFILSREQFQRAKSGDKVAFQWGRGEGKTQLDLGTLDKSKVQK